MCRICGISRRNKNSRTISYGTGILSPPPQENIFQDKQHCQYIHQSADLLFFTLTCDQVDGYVCINSMEIPSGNAVEERHCDDTYITWDRLGHIAEINADNIAEHVQSDDPQSRSCGKRGRIARSRNRNGTSQIRCGSCHCGKSRFFAFGYTGGFTLRVVVVDVPRTAPAVVATSSAKCALDVRKLTILVIPALEDTPTRVPSIKRSTNKSKQDNKKSVKSSVKLQLRKDRSKTRDRKSVAEIRKQAEADLGFRHKVSELTDDSKSPCDQDTQGCFPSHS